LVGVKKLDQRFASMTQAAGLTHFPRGISHVKQWTGCESKEMLKQTLPLVVGDLTPEQAQLMSSVIDFIFRAHSASMTDTDLDEMDATLDTFHQLKEVMVTKGFYESSKRFDCIPKLHMIGEYYLRFVPSEDPACPCDHNTLQTAPHVLYECPLHDAAHMVLRKASRSLSPSILFGTLKGLRAIATFLSVSFAFRKLS
jgi:hypothetical protein